MVCVPRLGDGVVPVAPPGPAAGETPERQPTALQHAVRFDRFLCVVRAGGGVAARGWPIGRQHALIDRELPLSPSYAFSFLSYLTGSSVDHCGAPLRCQKAQPARQRLNCSLQTGEWCIHAALPGNQQNVPTSEEGQSTDDLPEPAPSSVPCDRQRSGTLADDEPEADVRERVGA